MRRPGPDLAVSAAVTLVVLGPLLLGGGYWLVGDMVFVPHQPWKAAWLGLDDALPRAVPMDALVSLLTHVVPGSVVQRAVLLGGLLGGGLGVAGLVTRLGAGRLWYARAAAVVLFCWNPWVYERLLMGQWAILLGYLLLPWVARAALRLRRDPRDAAPAAVTLVLAAVCGPSSGLMALGVLAVLGLGRERSGWLRVAGIGVLANLTWAVPALTATGAHVGTDGVFAGFAARAESAAGTAVSVLSLGGTWKSSIVPPERTSAVLVVLAGLLSVVALAGLRRADDRARWWGLGGAAALLALLPTLPGGVTLLEAAADRAPALALLRDSHRYLAPLGLVLAVGTAFATEALRQRVRPGRGALWCAVVLVVVAPPLLLPSLAWGALGRLERSAYPQAWSDVAALVGHDDTTVVLPWAGSYRGYAWNHRRAVLDPAPRLLPGEVVVDDRVRLSDRVVPPEDPRVVEVARALRAPDPAAALRAAGVRWLLVERGMGRPDVPAAPVRYDGGGLTLLDLAAGGQVATDAAPEPGPARRIAVGLGHALAILLLFAGCAGILRAGSNEHHIHEGHGE